MPPRSRKVGLKRMDAAIDALTPMGFPPALTRRKVKDLLKEYGDEGWVFIEEASYKLLIECILEDQEQMECDQGESSSFRDSTNEAGGNGGNEVEPSEAEPLIESSEPSCFNQESGLADPSEVLKPTFSPDENVTSPTKNTTSNEVNRPNGIPIKKEAIAARSEDYMLSCPPGFEHLFPIQLGFASTKRKPCLGWIGPKDDQDYVLLEPAPFLGCKTGLKPRKRKSRWDVGPNDVV